MAESLPELRLPLLLLRPLQVRGGAHEFAQFTEAVGDVVLGQRLQQDEDGRLFASVAIEKPEVGEVQLIATPVGLHKVLGEDEDGPPATLHGAHDVVQNPVSGKEVPLVETQGQRPGSSVVHIVLIGLPVGVQTSKKVMFRYRFTFDMWKVQFAGSCKNT